MNLAILHYHLNPGGVTRVIANHLLSLDRTLGDGERLRVMLLFDGQRDGWPEDLNDQLSSIELIFRKIPSLGYRQQHHATDARLADEIRGRLSEAGFAPHETVLHAHNHSLGKNTAVPVALRELAEDGFALLLQPHDFAEDFRPSNYRDQRESLACDDLSAALYFQGPRVHYATLNRRDFNVLQDAGIRSDRLHFLPNPVLGVPQLPSRGQSRELLEQRFGIEGHTEYVLYPVRGIRRKNVGEFVLLSVLRNRLLQDSRHSQRSVFGLTLAPLNPIAIPYYERWTRLTNELDLPCRFGVGQQGGLSFPENLAAADRIVTTSVAEGFGMVFLESWLAGRGLVGRNLPEVTSDFTRAGVQLDALYNCLDVPVEWIGRERLARSIFAACQHVYGDYGLDVPSFQQVTAAVERATADGLVDFGILDEALQEAVIRRVASDPASCQTVLEANPALQRWDELDQTMIAENQSTVQKHYSLSACGERLRVIYTSLLASPPASVDEPAAADAILATFLNLDRFRLIRT